MSKDWTHAELVSRGARWLRNSYGCPVVLTETESYTGETPDVIGWKKTGRSVLIECKTSRSDFAADARKPFRENPLIALGAERYYMAPKGLLKPTDLPPDWGLVEVHGVGCKIVRPARPRKDLRSDLAKSYEMKLLITSLNRVQARLGAASLNEWLRWENRDQSPEQMQAWVGKEDHDLHILALRGFLPVVDPSDLPVDEASGEPWCPRHEMLFHGCECPSRFKGRPLEFEEHDGRLFARFGIESPEPPPVDLNNPLTWSWQPVPPEKTA